MTTLQDKSSKTPMGIWIAAVVALTFGALTLVSGGGALFGTSGIGGAVPFVLWFNFLSGFAYMAIGMGVLLRRAWANWAAAALAIAILVVFAFLGWHVLQGRAYEMRTIGAMVLRAGVWITIALYLRGITAKTHSKS